MTKKIAVLVNEDTMQRCSCGGWFKKIIYKKGFFFGFFDEGF